MPDINDNRFGIGAKSLSVALELARSPVPSVRDWGRDIVMRTLEEIEVSEREAAAAAEACAALGANLLAERRAVVGLSLLASRNARRPGGGGGNNRKGRTRFAASAGPQ